MSGNLTADGPHDPKCDKDTGEGADGWSILVTRRIKNVSCNKNKT